MRLLSLVLTIALAVPAPGDEVPISFRKDVAPILVAKCLGCHNDRESKHGLNLSTFALLKQGGKDEGDSILTPGDPDSSGLVESIRPGAPVRMPYKKPPLSKPEIRTLERWVQQGARFDGPSETDTRIATLVDPLQNLPKIDLRVPASDPVTAVAYSPDGKTLAAAVGRAVLLFDARTGAPASPLADHPGPLSAVRFTPDGKTLIAAGGRPGMFGAVTIWDLESRTRRHDLRGHADSVLGTALSPDGKTLATASYDRLIKLWDVTVGNEVRTLKEHTDAVYAVAFSPEGSTLASAAGDRTVKLWDVANGRRTATLSDAMAELYAVTFSPDGKSVLAGGVDRSIRAWEISGAGGKLVRSIFAHDGAVLRLLIAPDGVILYSTGEDRAVKVWDLADLKPRLAFAGQPDWPLTLAVSPDGAHVAVGHYDGSLRALDARTGQTILTLREAPKPEPPRPQAAAPKPELLRNPSLNPPSPRAAVRGSKVRVTLSGTGVGGASVVNFAEPKITPTLVPAPKPDANRLEIDLAIAADAPTGRHGFWVRTPLGMTPGQTFLVSDRPDTLEAEPNDDPRQATPATLPATLVGTSDRPGDVDHFRIEARAGQELVFEVVARGLGSTLSPAPSLLDAEGRVVAEATGLDADPTLTYRVPADGPLILRVADAQVGGSANHFYRIEAGAPPYPESAFPLAIQRGKTSRVIAVRGPNLDGSSAPAVAAQADAEPGSLVALPVGTAGPKLVVAEGPQAVEAEDNDTPEKANPVATPGGASGRIDRPGDSDLYCFEARKGRRLIVEVFGRRLGSPIDPVIEILDHLGRPVPRAVLRPVEETTVAFRDHGSASRAIRLVEWNDLAIGDDLLMGRELMKLDELPRNPDDDAVFAGLGNGRTNGGERVALLETTPEHHPLGQPAYKVEIHPPGTTFPPGGVPPVTLNYRNDDGGPGFSKDARLTLDPPADGAYLVRVEDVRGLGGDGFGYHLVIRDPRPDFRLTLSVENPNIPRGGAALITAVVNRLDGFDDPIAIAIEGLPPGVHASSPIVVERGATSTDFGLMADESAPVASPPTWRAVATAGALRHEFDPGGPMGGWVSVTAGPNLKIAASPERVEIRPGERVGVKFLVERGPAFAGRVPIEVKALPRGVRVLDIGLNGVLVTESQRERVVTLYAEPSAEPTERPFFAVGRAESAAMDHSSPPIPLVVRRAPAPGPRASAPAPQP